VSAENIEQKPKLEPDVEIKFRTSVEICSSKLEAFADVDDSLTADVSLLPQQGRWDVELTREYTLNPFSPTYFKLRFIGYFQRTDSGGTLLLGRAFPDIATYITRGLWLMLAGTPAIFIALRVGFRFPIIWLLVLGLLAGLIYGLAFHPDKVMKERRDELIADLTEELA